MQFGCPLAEQFYIFQIGTDQLHREGWNRRVLEALDKRHRLEEILQFVSGPSNRAIQILPELIERMPPGVTLVGYVSLQDADSRAIAFPGSILDGTSNGRSISEPNAFGQKRSDFQVRIHSFLSPPEKFQYVLIAENDGRITLFGAHRCNFKFREIG